MRLEIVIADSVVLDPATRAGLEALGTLRAVPLAEQADLYPAIRGASVVILGSAPVRLTREVMALCHGLRAVGLIGARPGTVDMEAADQLGVSVIGEEVPSASVADFIITLMLSLARNLVAAPNTDPAASDAGLMGIELEGKVVGLIGTGLIGTEVARRVVGFGMTVIAHDPLGPYPGVETEEIPTVDDLTDLLARSDFVSIYLPDHSNAHHLINDTALAYMKETAFLIAIDPGSVVDAEALARSLEAGEIAGAGIDGRLDASPSTISSLAGLGRVVLTPGIATVTEEARLRSGASLVRGLAALSEGVRPSEITPKGPSHPAPPDPPDAHALLPYHTWYGDGLPHPTHTTYRGTLPGLRAIVASEGPVTTDRLYNRYIRGAGFKRVTEPARRTLAAALGHLERGGEVEVDSFEDSLSDGGRQRVVRRRGTPDVVVREIGDRDLYQVPLNEVATLMRWRTERFPASTEEELMRHVFDRYGRKSLTKKARGYLEMSLRLAYGLPEAGEEGG